MGQFEIKYYFRFRHNEEREYAISLDDETILMKPRVDPQKTPHWTLLSHASCGECCPSDQAKHCPIAVNLSDILDTFKNVKSIETCHVRVETPQRTYVKDTDIQNGLGSLLGLIMATSGCPAMSFLKPMARFHLPFASTEETIFRSFGNLLIREYLKGDVSKESVIRDLTELYDKVGKINRNLLARIDSITQDKNAADADQNAIVILDTFATMLSIQLEDNVSMLQYLYEEEEGKPEGKS